MARWHAFGAMLVMGLAPHLEVSATDKYLIGWWHSLDFGTALGDSDVNYRAPSGSSGNRIKMPGKFDQAISLTYSLQQHDLVLPGYYAGAYWGVGVHLVSQSLSERFPGGELKFDSLMLIPRLQVGLTWRIGDRFMIQAGGFAGFGVSSASIELGFNESSDHMALAYEHGFEIKSRYSLSEKLFVSLGFTHNHREADHSSRQLFFGGALGAALVNTDVDQDTYAVTGGLGMKFLARFKCLR